MSVLKGRSNVEAPLRSLKRIEMLYRQTACVLFVTAIISFLCYRQTFEVRNPFHAS